MIAVIDTMIESDEIFEMIIKMPSPFIQYANFHDFFFAYLRQYYEKKHCGHIISFTTHSQYYMENASI